MILSQKAGAVVLPYEQGSPLLQLTDLAKVMDYQGKRHIAVKHTLDTARVMNNMGIEVPSPITYAYDWMGRFTPYEHQAHTASFCTMNPAAYVLNDIGTGKTLSALWAADYMMKCGFANKALILSPLSTVDIVWGDSIFENFPNRNFIVLHGTSAQRRKWLDLPHDFYILNHDGFDTVSDLLAKRPDIDLIIVDELAVYRNPRTERFKRFVKYLDAKRVQSTIWGMTGSPVPNEPTDAWAQARLVTPRTIPRAYTKFRDMVMMKVDTFKWVARPDAIDIVKHVLQPAIRYERDECLDLPETVTSYRKVQLSKEQKAAFDSMAKHLYIQGMAGEITAANEAVKRNKLVQICLGGIFDEKSNWLELDSKPRIREMIEIIGQTEHKVIVFAPLRGPLHPLRKELEKKGIQAAVVDGSVSRGKRREIFTSFQKRHNPRVIIAHPGCMSHGLTLTEAATILWYGPTDSADIYEQANGRITRPGQTHIANIIHLVATEVERKIFQRIERKQKLQGFLLDEIKLLMKGAC